MGAEEEMRGEIRRRILELTRARGAGKSICPSEVARLVAPEAWRPWMEAVRAEAQRLVDERLVEATQAGQPVDLRVARGPVRLRVRASERREP